MYLKLKTGKVSVVTFRPYIIKTTFQETSNNYRYGLMQIGEVNFLNILSVLGFGESCLFKMPYSITNYLLLLSMNIIVIYIPQLFPVTVYLPIIQSSRALG